MTDYTAEKPDTASPLTARVDLVPMAGSVI
jgi:hypothetical protein